MGRIVIKTNTAGWFEQYDPDTDGPMEKRVRKYDDDTVVEDLDGARAFYREYRTHIAPTTTTTTIAADAAAKADKPVTVASTGKILVGKTIEIKCAWSGCSAKRVIKPQDKFQVRYCVEHQTEHRKQVRREKQKAKAQARRDAKAAAALVTA